MRLNVAGTATSVKAKHADADDQEVEGAYLLKTGHRCTETHGSVIDGVVVNFCTEDSFLFVTTSLGFALKEKRDGKH